MTLIDQANFVCGKVNQTEAEDVLACKGFLQRRFNLLWACALWKDSLVSYIQTLNPTGYTAVSTWLPVKGVLLVPPIVERVLAVRTDSRKLNVQRPEFYYRVDFDAFSKVGPATDFLLLPPCVWEFEEFEDLLLSRNSGADAAVTVKIDILDVDGVGITRVSTTMGNDPTDFGSTDRIDAVLKVVTTDYIRILVGALPVVVLGAADTAAKIRQRVRLVNIPDASLTIRVLGKRSAPAFLDDLDSPGLTGVENCLLAFAQGDMLQRERHYAKAQALYQEGQLLLGQLKEQETVQQAHEQRIIPETGYGEDTEWGGFSF